MSAHIGLRDEALPDFLAEKGQEGKVVQDFEFACPVCRAALEFSGEEQDEFQAPSCRCPADGQVFERRAGIWRFMPPDRLVAYWKFIRDYEAVRKAEQRGSPQTAFYRALPFQDLSGQRPADWAIRATSYRALLRRVIQPLEARTGKLAAEIGSSGLDRPAAQLRILDLGAGNGWLSNRLASRGHRVAAVDLLDNDWDGLGAFRHYENTFTCVQAEFDRLPFRQAQADLLIFNASLHYSTDYLSTLGEALRVLRPDGVLVALDSPVYNDPSSGEQMVRDRETHFQQAYGFASNALPSKNFLVRNELDQLAIKLKIEWMIIQPYYGLRWALRPWLAFLSGRREPARFQLLCARRSRPMEPGPG